MTDAASIVVGVVPGQPTAVAEVALRFAERFAARLEFVHVDVNRYPVAGEFGEDPLVELSLPIDPDTAETREPPFDPLLVTRLEDLIGARVPWRVHRMAGDPARGLSLLADRTRAEMIVVGTREPTVRASVREFLAGSVAAHLAHRQGRPVVVVPLAPVDPGAKPPWE